MGASSMYKELIAESKEIVNNMKYKKTPVEFDGIKVSRVYYKIFKSFSKVKKYMKRRFSK